MGKLKESLINLEKMEAEGNYPELIIKKEKPIEWEMLFDRLTSLVQNARENSRRISASPVIREMGECIFAVFTPEGDAIAFSTGLFLHVPNKGMAIKWMLKHDYEEKVGINEGDVFFNNDPYIAGTHTADQMNLSPIFYKGEIVGWAGGLNHVLEVGAIEPGGTSIIAQTRYEEGLFVPCVKIAENNQLKDDLEIMVERNIRPSIWWPLDNRARMAGIKIIENGVKQLIDEFGLEIYKKSIYEYIEDTRQACAQKTKTVLFPGKYHAVNYFDIVQEGLPVSNQENYLVRIPIEVTVTPKGEMIFDFEGTAPAALHPFNASLPTTNGNMINQLIQGIYYDVKYNQGTFKSYKTIVPSSVLNPPDIVYATGNWTTAVIASSNLVECLSRALYEMGFREEVWGGLPSITWLHIGGTDQYGRPIGTSLFESAYAGMPASGVLDGLDVAYGPYNPEVECADAERWDRLIPILFLGRRIARDSSGFGKYRGGNGLEELIMVNMDNKITMSIASPSSKSLPHHGIMGGYPSGPMHHSFIQNTNMKELISKQKPLPYSEGDDPSNPDWSKMGVKGEVYFKTGNTSHRKVQKYDLVHLTSIGSGGYGDPIERDPKLIEEDIKNQVLSLDVAERIYKVYFKKNTMELDIEKTKNQRTALRDERKSRGIPADQYLKREAEKIRRGDLAPMAKKSLNECLRTSEHFSKSFRDFWKLPDNFVIIP